MPKKGKGKKVKGPKPEPPFLFQIDQLNIENNPGFIKLFPKEEADFKEMNVNIRISKNEISGKPEYEIMYIKAKETEPYIQSVLLTPFSKHNVQSYQPEDLKPFTMYDVENGNKIDVYPERTSGIPPFVILEPNSGEEKTVKPPHMIHYVPASGKRYLINNNHLENGKLTFNDPETQEPITVDVTKRVDPLTGDPLEETADNEFTEFVGQLMNGQVYFTKNPKSGQLKILDYNGYPVDGFRAVYEPSEDTTIVFDENGETVLRVPGKYQMDEEEIQEQKQAANNKVTFDKAGPSPLNKPSSSAMPEFLNYYTVQNPKTGEIEILDKYGQRVKQDGSEAQFYKVTDPVTGKSVFVDSTGQTVYPNMFYQVVDPETGRTVFLDSEGKPITLEDLNLGVEPPKKQNENRITYLKQKRGKEAITPPNAEQQPADGDTEEVKYFANMNTEEADNILSMMNNLTQERKMAFLSILKEKIEFEKNLIHCVMEKKMKEERQYMQKFLKEKEDRQNQFIADLFRGRKNPYDRNEIKTIINAKIERENEHIFDVLHEKIMHENKLIMDLFHKEFKTIKAILIEQTNKRCYHNCKAIIFSYLMEKMEKEIEQIKQEIWINLQREKLVIFEQIDAKLPALF